MEDKTNLSCVAAILNKYSREQKSFLRVCTCLKAHLIMQHFWWRFIGGGNCQQRPHNKSKKSGVGNNIIISQMLLLFRIRKNKNISFWRLEIFFHPKTKASTAVSHTNVISVVSSSSSSNIFAHAVAELKHVSGIFKNRALKIFSTEKEKKNWSKNEKKV